MCVCIDRNSASADIVLFADNARAENGDGGRGDGVKRFM